MRGGGDQAVGPSSVGIRPQCPRVADWFGTTGRSRVLRTPRRTRDRTAAPPGTTRTG